MDSQAPAVEAEDRAPRATSDAMANIPAGNDPFAGGSITRTGQANVAGGIPSANTSVGNPIGGVNPGGIFSARNNQGSNIGIPYTRLCPLGSKQGAGLGRPPTPAVEANAPDPPDLGQPLVVNETENLRSMTLAFILGKRSGPGVGVPLINPDGSEILDMSGEASVDFGFSFNTNGAIAPGMPGTERFQKLCSFEYLSRYFTNALWTKGIILCNNDPAGVNAANAGGTFANGLGAAPLPSEWTTGLPRMVKAAADAREADRLAGAGTPGRETNGVALNAALNAATLTNTGDIGQAMGLDGSAAATATRLRQGIFAHDIGPFLRGKGITHEMLAGTRDASLQGVGMPAGTTEKTYLPYHVSRCAGDELAFALFERLLEEKGFSDWRPDGVVLSKGADDPSDKLSDEMLKSRDGELFNIRIQGPAVTSTWTGDPALEVMPLDKVFVVIVADVWWGDLDTTAGALSPASADVKRLVDGLMNPNGTYGAIPGGNLDAKRAAWRAYLKAREIEFTEGPNALTKLPPPVKKVSGRPYAGRPMQGGGEGRSFDDLNGNNGVALNAKPVAIALTGGYTQAQVDARDAERTAWDNALREAQYQWDRAQTMVKFQEMSRAALRNGTEVTRLCNFRVKLATSSQMVNYSAPRFDGAGKQVCSPSDAGDEYRRVHNQSRMGLRLSLNGGEYIVGGWCIGNVLDTAASRAAFPSAGTNIGVRTAPNSMAVNLNVKVEWWDSDRMWRSFMNVDESLTPRYAETKPLVGVDVNPATGAKTPNGNFLYSSVNMPPGSALAIAPGVYARANNVAVSTVTLAQQLATARNLSDALV